MPTLSDKDQQIIAQVAVKTAVEGGISPLDLPALKLAAENAFTTILELADLEIGALPSGPSASVTPISAAPSVQEQAVATVAAAFPGTTVTDAPTGGESYVEKLWRDVATNPSNWFDNRGEKAADPSKSKRPDFKAKRSGPTNSKGEPAALWLSSDSTPDWAKQQFGL